MSVRVFCLFPPFVPFSARLSPKVASPLFPLLRCLFIGTPPGCPWGLSPLLLSESPWPHLAFFAFPVAFFPLASLARPFSLVDRRYFLAWVWNENRPHLSFFPDAPSDLRLMLRLRVCLVEKNAFVLGRSNGPHRANFCLKLWNPLGRAVWCLSFAHKFSDPGHPLDFPFLLAHISPPDFSQNIAVIRLRRAPTGIKFRLRQFSTSFAKSWSMPPCPA